MDVGETLKNDKVTETFLEQITRLHTEADPISMYSAIIGRENSCDELGYFKKLAEFLILQAQTSQVFFASEHFGSSWIKRLNEREMIPGKLVFGNNWLSSLR